MSTYSGTASLNPMNGLILIVDDTPMNLDVISETLSQTGLEVAIATSGERALIQVQRRLPDLILLDVMMPGIDGFETCRRLKADSHMRHVPIIFMTALDDVSSKVRGLELGAVDYITKPFQEQEVLARIKTHLHIKKTEERLRQSEARLESILEHLEEVVWSAKISPFQLSYVNSSLERVYGYAVDSFLKNPGLWFTFIHPEDREWVQTAFQNIKPGQSLDIEYRILTANHEVRWLHNRAHWIESDSSGEGHLDGIIHDVSDRKAFENQLLIEAQHDHLTGLPNRNFFLKRVNQLLEGGCTNRQLKFAILFIDLDRFKNINDSLGHLAGDQLLIHVCKVLQAALRPGDLVARLGGDEFTIILDNLLKPEDAFEIAERIQEQLSQPIEIEGHRIFTTASIGIVMENGRYQKAEELLRDADIAMYKAKHNGKACHRLFSFEMYEQTVDRLNIERDLRLALQRNEISMHYQPIMSLMDESLVGLEALVRWTHPIKGTIGPDQFIPIAEETGLIIPLGDYILRKVCENLRDWMCRYPQLSPPSVSVNLSGKQLQAPDFLGKLDRIFQETQVAPQQIQLEITESLLIDNSDAVLRCLQALRKRGIRLSLDDFGTGYSSLSYLHHFPINTLKIDQSFVKHLNVQQRSSDIIETITTLAQVLKMSVVAEGIENDMQMQHLKHLGCEVGQGFLLSRPLSLEQIELWLPEHMDPLQSSIAS